MYKELVLAILMLFSAGLVCADNQSNTSLINETNISNISKQVNVSMPEVNLTVNLSNVSEVNVSENGKFVITVSEDNISATIYIVKRERTYFWDNIKNYFFVFWNNQTLRIVVPVMIVLIIVLIYFRTRETPENNIKKARRYHKLAEKHHERGNEEKSKKYFEMSRYYREKNL